MSTGFIPFVIFLIAMTAELNRPPFDLVEAEQELVGGFNTEYCSIRFALFFLAEFMNVITMSAVMVTLFLGGPQPLRSAVSRSVAHPGRQHLRLGRCVQRHDLGGRSRCSASSTPTSGSGRRCPGSATTS